MTDWTTLDWESILKGLGVAGGAVASAFQARNLIPPTRARLKADLEILKMLDPADEGAPLVREHTTRTIRRLYGHDERSSHLTIYSWGDLILGLILLPVFSVWTVYLVKAGQYWWTPVTGFAAFAGIGAVLNALDPKSAKAEDSVNKA